MYKRQLEYQADGLLIREETYSFTPEIDGALYVSLRSDRRQYLFKLEPTLYTGRNWLKRYATCLLYTSWPKVKHFVENVVQNIKILQESR